jgi:divalent metal cation (Fe/Co/Zn/Cd) transporter
VAALGVWSSHAFDAPVLDGVASVVIGVLLCGVAVVLVHESRGLLVGEGIRPATAAAVREIAQAQAGVKRVGMPLSMYIGPREVLLTLDVEFDAAVPASRIAHAVADIESEIRRRYPVIRRIYIEAGCIAASLDSLQQRPGLATA